jgi:hypothetical protein
LKFFRELRLAFFVEGTWWKRSVLNAVSPIRGDALIDVRRDRADVVRQEKHQQHIRHPSGRVVGLVKGVLPDAEAKKDYWKAPYSDVKEQFKESQKQ